jgi:GTP-binding protein HflX
VGYTNAGKSSVLRALTGDHEIVVEDRLFATLDTLTREVDIGENVRVRVTDTVGFIRKLPHHLVASFRATLEEAREADVLLHVIDASHEEWEEQVAVVDQVLGELEMSDRPVVMVFNKIDLVADPAAFATRIRGLHPDAVFATTMQTDGVDAIKAALRERVRTGRPTLRVVVPEGDGARLAAVYRAGEVLSREHTAEGVVLTVRMEGWRAQQLSETNGAA